jgi:hypothetical protein
MEDFAQHMPSRFLPPEGFYEAVKSVPAVGHHTSRFGAQRLLQESLVTLGADDQPKPRRGFDLRQRQIRIQLLSEIIERIALQRLGSRWRDSTRRFSSFIERSQRVTFDANHTAIMRQIASAASTRQISHDDGPASDESFGGNTERSR